VSAQDYYYNKKNQQGKIVKNSVQNIEIEYYNNVKICNVSTF